MSHQSRGKSPTSKLYLSALQTLPTKTIEDQLFANYRPEKYLMQVKPPRPRFYTRKIRRSSKAKKYQSNSFELIEDTRHRISMAKREQ